MKVYKFKCDSCGSKQYIKTETGYKCKYCGSFHDVIVPQVEKPQLEENKESTEKFEIMLTEYDSRTTLIHLLVCFFLGFYGIHKFLERKIFIGLIYMFTFGLMGVGWFVDMYHYAADFAEARKRSGGEK